jgi:uncharacterized protein (TIGR02246 family)
MTSDHRAIEALIFRYAQLVDDGDLDGLGALLAEAVFTGSGASLRGRDEIAGMFHRTVIIHPDGTPRTQHVVSNLVVEVADDRASAAARSYVTVFQALPDAPLRPIAAGRYADRFVRRDDGWRFAARTVDIRLVGDVGRHLRVDRA